MYILFFLPFYLDIYIYIYIYASLALRVQKEKYKAASHAQIEQKSYLIFIPFIHSPNVSAKLPALMRGNILGFILKFIGTISILMQYKCYVYVIGTHYLTPMDQMDQQTTNSRFSQQKLSYRNIRMCEGMSQRQFRACICNYLHHNCRDIRVPHIHLEKKYN